MPRNQARPLGVLPMRRLAVVAASIVAAFASHEATADTVNFTLDNPVQTITSSGGKLSFVATVSAPLTNTGIENLNGDSFNINPSNMFDVDDSGFFNDFPLFLAPGDSYTGTLFTLGVPAGATAQTYTGTLALLGGPSFESFDTLGTATFSVDVTAVAAAAPEPGTWGMMILGFGVAGYAVRRRQVAVTRVVRAA